MRDKFAVWLANKVLRTFASRRYRANLEGILALGFREAQDRLDELEDPSINSLLRGASPEAKP